ncbi:MAG TPA: hypothetical protein VL728_16710 [Cyclobacteriaceae bacterium]|jgi:hypothetical protein|nr:hypothetical protein [Cyclobacteriaceae bacterium]
MKSKTLLRIACALILIHLIGHSMGHLQWDKPKDPKMKEVVEVMKGYSSEFMGATKSMANYFEGYSIILFFVFGMTILILWSVSGFIETNRPIAIKILYPIAITYLAFGVIEYLYFFLFAASISFLAGVCVFLGINSSK